MDITLRQSVTNQNDVIARQMSAKSQLNIGIHRNAVCQEQQEPVGSSCGTIQEMRVGGVSQSVSLKKGYKQVTHARCWEASGQRVATQDGLLEVLADHSTDGQWLHCWSKRWGDVFLLHQ